MRREGTRKLLLIVSIFIIIVLIVSSYIIYIGSLNNQIINVTIEVDKSNYDINENVTFTLTNKDTSIPFSIEELAEGGGLCICRIPDSISPYQLLQNRSLLNSLTSSPVDRIGLSNYSNDDKILKLIWNGTYFSDNNRLSDRPNGSYYLAPSGYYIMYRSDISSSTNDNVIRFNVNERSIFYIGGLTPFLSCDYLNESSALNIHLSIESNSYINGTPLDVHLAQYLENDSQEEKMVDEQWTVIWHQSYTHTIAADVTFDEGTWIRIFVIISIPQGEYSIYWADFHEVDDG